MGSELYNALMGKSEKIAKENAKIFEHEKITQEQIYKDENDILSEQVDNRATEQVNNRTSEQLSEQQSKWTSEQLSEQQSKWTSGQVDNRASGQVAPFDPQKKPADLKLNQFRILYEIYHSRPFKVAGKNRIGGQKDFPIPYGTVRNCLKSLMKKKYIFQYFSINDGVQKGTTCQINEAKCVHLFGMTYIINSEQVDNRASEQVDNRASEQVDSSYKKERKILLNNLSFSNFWVEQGLTKQKLNTWIEEFDFTEKEWESQLAFGEYEPKVRQAESPIKYFYKSLKAGGLTRPNGFELPEERLARIRKQEHVARQKLIEEEEKLRQKEKELVKREFFLALLKDKEAVKEAIAGIEQDKFLSSNLKKSLKYFRETGQITEILETRLHRWFRSEEEPESTTMQ